MLGYTLPYYNRLSPADNRIYRRYYCEGCHQLKQGFGLTSTLTVNYDMTFNTILLNSIAGDVLDFEGTHRRLCFLDKPKADSDLLRDMAAYTMILVKWELRDDDTDNPSVKSKIASTALSKAIRKAVDMFPEYDRMVGEGFACGCVPTFYQRSPIEFYAHHLVDDFCNLCQMLAIYSVERVK